MTGEQSGPTQLGPVKLAEEVVVPPGVLPPEPAVDAVNVNGRVPTLFGRISSTTPPPGPPPGPPSPRAGSTADGTQLHIGECLGRCRFEARVID